VAGREFERTDRRDAEPVAIVNEAAARQLWPDGVALGQRLRASADPASPWLEVVGIVAGVKVNTPGESSTSQIFFPVLQDYNSYQSLVVQTRGDPAALLPAVRQTFQALDPDVGIVSAGLLADRVATGLWPARFAALLLGALGVAGLAIASLGLYGAVAHAVSQRTRELGIRVALGAHVRDVMRLVVGDGMQVVGIGLVTGVVLAAIVSRLLGTFLYGVSPWDPVAFLAGPLVLALVGAAACWVPARRATRVDPVEALRSE
jgi:ABC-type antimicrobial peptide transport system permease subunit